MWNLGFTAVCLFNVIFKDKFYVFIILSLVIRKSVVPPKLPTDLFSFFFLRQGLAIYSAQSSIKPLILLPLLLRLWNYTQLVFMYY